MYDFHFKAKGFSFDMYLDGRVSQLEEDNSGVGKSYVFNKLRGYSIFNYEKELENFIFISDKNDVKLFKNLNVSSFKDKVILIDNMEILKYDEDFLNLLREARIKNHILVIGRGTFPLGIRISDLLYLKRKDKDGWEISGSLAYAHNLRRVLNDKNNTK